MNTTYRKGAALGALVLAGALVGGAGAANAALTASPANGAKAQGEVTFDCLLLPFNSAFRYTGPATISVPSKADGDVLELKGQFPDLPELAPVPIENGKMRVWTKGTVGDSPLELSGSSVVNAAANSKVPLPKMKGEVQGLEDGAKIDLTTFGFEFDEMIGLSISAQCDAVSGSSGGKLVLGSAAAEEKGGEETTAASVGDAVEEEGSAMKFALLGLPVVVAAGALLAWLPRRRAARS